MLGGLGDDGGGVSGGTNGSDKLETPSKFRPQKSSSSGSESINSSAKFPNSLSAIVSPKLAIKASAIIILLTNIMFNCVLALRRMRCESVECCSAFCEICDFEFGSCEQEFSGHPLNQIPFSQ